MWVPPVMGFISSRQIPHWQEVLKGVPKVIPPPFCPASQCQLGLVVVNHLGIISVQEGGPA